MATKKFPATLLCDFYKVSHREQYPDKTEYIYSTWTPRTSRVKGISTVVAFGFQRVIKKYLIDYFNDNFFNRPKEEVVAEYRRVIKFALGVSDPYTKHIEELHDLGYLPIKIKALVEGTLCPIRIPMLTMHNTDKRFYWLTNYLETIMSCELWHPATTATLALEYRKILNRFAIETVGNTDFVKFQGHDFSMRGMECLEGSASGSMGHLLSFAGTDTIPAILELENYYYANIENELVGCSVNATEHSVMCAGGANDEFETYRRLIVDVYKEGIVSIVSDTWDLWHVLTNTIPKLKEAILARNGKVVIRPDSGDPVKIICGYKVADVPYDDDSVVAIDRLIDAGYDAYRLIDGRVFPCNGRKELSAPEVKGVVELLWETFGGTTNALGYKELDSHIGAIYGDSITLERCEAICEQLKAKGFASTNCVFGIGSYTYQYVTRDTFGFALKSTHVIIDGVESNIFKDPITDDGTKKSATGRVAIAPRPDGKMKLIDGLNSEEEKGTESYNLLETIFENGVSVKEVTLQEIRTRLGGI